MPTRAFPRNTRLSGVDVFAFADSDSDETRTYTTYLGYWDCLARHIIDTYGTDWSDALLKSLRARKPYRALSGKTLFAGDSSDLSSLLLNAWNSEVNLYLVDDDDVRLQPAVQWAPVCAYYATGRAGLGWLLVRDGVAPTGHRQLLRALAGQIGNSPLFPEPWCMHVKSLEPLTWGAFPSDPRPCSNLASNVPPVDGIGKLLKTTRRRRVEELKDGVRVRLRRQQAPAGEFRRQDARLEPTTVFDFAWRSRSRSNYGDPSMFYVGSLGSQGRARRFVRSIRTFTAATMLVFESLIAQRAPNTLVDAAVHYISRDRTQISDTLVGARLRTLGLLSPA